MEKEILKEIIKECKWFERIIVVLFGKTILKIYHYARINIINNMIK